MGILPGSSRRQIVDDPVRIFLPNHQIRFHALLLFYCSRCSFFTDSLENPALLHLIIDQEEKDIHHELSQRRGDTFQCQPPNRAGVAKQIGAEQYKISDRFGSDAPLTLKTPIPVERKIQYTGSEPGKS